MKKFIFNLIITATLFLTIHTESIVAQGSLEFSRVILLEAGNSVQTIPNDKVWKIVSVTGFSQILSSSRPSIININGVTNHLGYVSIDGNGRIYQYAASLPMWLPEGTTVELPAINPGGLRSMSIIEFTVVQ